MDRAKLELDEVFAAALELASPVERAAYLDQSCGDDLETRRRVERLLAAHFQAGSFLGASPSVDAATTDLPTPIVGTMIGPYKLLEQIGEGGFGVVFMAEQTEPVRRKVALKILKPGMDTRQVVARFEAERQALAIMDHPNIAKVFDGGSTDRTASGLACADQPTSEAACGTGSGRPYFVMELVKGSRITDFCDQNHLTPRRRLELFLSVCHAVQHAHNKGIIHRDLKPSNVLVSRHDTTPVVKVIDFGVAKALGQELTDKTMFTGVMQMIGTPLYMSPEQAGMSDLDIDTRSDIHTLGVLLYELLTGTTPFDKDRFKHAGYDEIRRIIREEEPPKPSTRLFDLGRSRLPGGTLAGTSDDTASARDPAGRETGPARQAGPTSIASISAQRLTEPAKLTKLVKGELDWIVMKALDKDRNRRYETANAFAADVQRFLNDEPVEACPPSAGYRLRKFVRKNRVPLTTAVTFAILLAVGAAISIWQAIRATGAEEDALLAVQDQRTANETALKRLAQIEKGNEILRSIFKNLNPDSEETEGKSLRVLLGERLDIAVRELHEEAVGDPVAVARLQLTLGDCLLALGFFEKGIDLLAKARAAFTRHLGPEHLDTIEAMGELALGYGYAGKLDVALPLFKEALTLSKKKRGAHHRDTLTLMNNVAAVYMEAGRPELALPLLKETLKLRRDTLGPDHTDVLESMGNLAVGYQAAGEPHLALQMAKETFERREENLGAAHPSTLTAMNNLASFYLKAGKLEMALPMLEKSLELSRKELGPYHHHTLGAMANLASAYERAGKRDLALSLREQRLKLSSEKLGSDHPDTLHAMNELATSLMSAGKQTLAVAMLEQAADGIERRGFAHTDAEVILGMLCRWHEQLDQFEHAETWRRKWMQVVKKRAGVNSVAYPAELAWLGRNLLNQGKFLEAEEILRESLAILDRQAPDHWLTFRSQSLLGGALLGRKNYADAEPLLVHGYHGMKRGEGKTPVANLPKQAWHRLSFHLEEALERLVQLYEGSDQQLIEIREGTLSAAKLEALHELSLQAGQIVAVTMEAQNFDTYLLLVDDKDTVLAENDDISASNLNSRLVFAAPKDGVYRIVATSFKQRGRGAYTLSIRQFKPKPSEVKPPAGPPAKPRETCSAKDKDLDPLRDREDFKKLIAEVEKKSPPKPKR